MTKMPSRKAVLRCLGIIIVYNTMQPGPNHRTPISHCNWVFIRIPSQATAILGIQ